MHISIDGSQIPSVSGYAVTGNILNNSTELHPKTPILDCELNAIEHAVDLTSIDYTKNFTIYCDAINAVSSIHYLWTNDPVIQECQELYTKLKNRSNTVTVTWVSAHICNIGDGKPPSLDKEAANSPNFSHYNTSQPEKTTLRLLIKKVNDN